MPREPVSRGFRYEWRLDWLQATDVLVIVCPTCRKRWLVPPYRLHERYRPSMRLVDIERDMRCRCGHRGAMTWWVERASPGMRVV